MDAQNQKLLLEKIRAYKIPNAAKDLIRKYPPLLIAGVSSVGKNTISDRITELSNYQRVITCTTRQPRSQESHGLNYWFINEDGFSSLIDSQSLIEVQLVHGETIYGTTIEAYEAVVKAGNQPLLLVDIYGAIKFVQYMEHPRAFFLIPPSYDEWMQRFHMRGHISHTEHARRLKTAKDEIEVAINARHVEVLVAREVNQAAKDIIQGWVSPTLDRNTQEIAERLLEHIRSY